MAAFAGVFWSVVNTHLSPSSSPPARKRQTAQIYRSKVPPYRCSTTPAATVLIVALENSWKFDMDVALTHSGGWCESSLKARSLEMQIWKQTGPATPLRQFGSLRMNAFPSPFLLSWARRLFNNSGAKTHDIHLWTVYCCEPVFSLACYLSRRGYRAIPVRKASPRLQPRTWVLEASSVIPLDPHIPGDTEYLRQQPGLPSTWPAYSGGCASEIAAERPCCHILYRCVQLSDFIVAPNMSEAPVILDHETCNRLCLPFLPRVQARIVVFPRLILSPPLVHQKKPPRKALGGETSANRP